MRISFSYIKWMLLTCKLGHSYIFFSQMKRMRIHLSFLIGLLAVCTWVFADSTSKFDPFLIFDKTNEIVSQNFYDQTFRGLPWAKLVQKARLNVSSETTEESLKQIINELLSKLKTSHTDFFSNSDQSYWALKSIFSHKIEGERLQQIGSWFQNNNGKWFIKNVFEGSPSWKAGLLSGDEVISVNDKPFSPVKSFLLSNTSKSLSIQIRRRMDGAITELKIKPRMESFQETLLKASQASTRIITHKKFSIGYFHLWAGTHEEFKKALIKAAVQMEKDSDAMILDLRDGFGGSDPSFLNPFFNTDDEGQPIQQIFTKPLVALINGGTRSGKEWITHLLKERARATLVGVQTAGYFLAGKPFDIDDGLFLLYLAVNGDGPPGVDLEGKGVKPDIEVPFTFQYSAGKDPQLKRALVFLETKLK